MASFCDRLKELRNAKGVTQKAMADVLGLKDDRSYRLYEAGKIDPPASKTIKLADYFDVSTDYLLGLTDNPFSNKKAIDKEIIKSIMPTIEVAINNAVEKSINMIIETLEKQESDSKSRKAHLTRIA